MNEKAPGSRRKPQPLVDLSAALGEAGHETEDLGYEGVPDTGPVLHEDDDTSGAGADAAVEHAANLVQPD